MITERDVAIIHTVAHYYVLSRVHIQRLCFPNDRSGRATRRRLQALVDEKLVNRSREPLFNSRGGSPWPVYFPARRGAEILAEHFSDERFLATSTQPPQPIHVLHWLAITDTHIALDLAIAQQDAVKVEGWLSEWDTVNKDESRPEHRYRIYTLLRENPRLVCAPDAAFLLSLGEHRKVFYLEQDRATSGVRQIAGSKTPGYAEMASRRLHLRHFPDSTVSTFSVLMIAPNERRRDALRKSLSGKPGAELWKFAAVPDVTADKFLYKPIWYTCDEGPTPLVKGD